MTTVGDVAGGPQEWATATGKDGKTEVPNLRVYEGDQGALLEAISGLVKALTDAKTTMANKDGGTTDADLQSAKDTAGNLNKDSKEIADLVATAHTWATDYEAKVKAALEQLSRL